LAAFEAVDFGADVVGDFDGALGTIIEHDENGVSFGGYDALGGAVDAVGHFQAGAADGEDTGGDEQRVGKGELAAEIALEGGEDGANAVAVVGGAEVGSAEVFDAGGLHPAEIDDVVDVVKGVLVAPLNGPRHDEGVIGQFGGDFEVHAVCIQKNGTRT
jgi:hypothetical protein